MTLPSAAGPRAPAFLDLGGLTDDQLRRALLAIGGLLAGGPDRPVALAELQALREEQTRAGAPGAPPEVTDAGLRAAWDAFQKTWPYEVSSQLRDALVQGVCAYVAHGAWSVPLTVARLAMLMRECPALDYDDAAAWILPRLAAPAPAETP